MMLATLEDDTSTTSTMYLEIHKKQFGLNVT